MSDKAVEFEVFAGQARLRFNPGVSCGRSPDNRPGVSFDLISDSPAHFIKGQYIHGNGVISRTDAKCLADMLNEFLAAHPPANPPPPDDIGGVVQRNI